MHNCKTGEEVLTQLGFIFSVRSLYCFVATFQLGAWAKCPFSAGLRVLYITHMYVTCSCTPKLCAVIPPGDKKRVGPILGKFESGSSYK
jgi:hypothetical protein